MNSADLAPLIAFLTFFVLTATCVLVHLFLHHRREMVKHADRIAHRNASVGDGR